MKLRVPRPTGVGQAIFCSSFDVIGPDCGYFNFFPVFSAASMKVGYSKSIVFLSLN